MSAIAAANSLAGGGFTGKTAECSCVETYPKVITMNVASASSSFVSSATPRKSASASATAVSFGSGIAYAEPLWYNPRFHSSYYTDSHIRFRAKVREFTEKHLKPHVSEWDEEGTHPEALRDLAYESGLLAALWPKEYGGTPPEGCEHADPFHDLILVDELSRCGGGGILWSIFFSFGIALPPVLNFGSEYVKGLCARQVITGKHVMALAVSEPNAGSDVAGLSTTAIKDPSGKFYVVNGSKKFITSGMKAKWLTTAVRTGGKGHGGVSLLLIDAESDGVQRTRMRTQGWWTSNTALIAFNDVRVPVENLIGEEGNGFKYIMINFNHERFVLAAMSNRYARLCYESAVEYAKRRRTFDKRLADHQVIRHKCAEMARQIETNHAWLEQIAYQMKCGVHDTHLSGTIALLKVSCTRAFDCCARESSQIFGGASAVRGGVADVVERLYREVRINAIGGGSEEILNDLAMKQAKL